MHHIYGKNNWNNGFAFDAVIPNYFDVQDFPFKEEKEDYVLYIGRLIGRK